MPKRPCALQLTTDDTTILSGDKFGDVYSLPLLPKDENDVQSSEKDVPSSKAFQPGATELTVHTQRNLKALEQQLRNGQSTPQKSGPTFERKLLVGHVSMLTDLAFVSLPAESKASRTYLLTSDRDEHIRVSRGPPQTHIIENYCFGHTSFVSKLCIPDWCPKTLISGGGDEFMLVWDWLRGSVTQKIDLAKIAGLESEGDASEVAVSNILAVPLKGIAGIQETKGSIIVALEG